MVGNNGIITVVTVIVNDTVAVVDKIDVVVDNGGTAGS